MTAGPIDIEATGIGKSFGAFRALDDVSLGIKRGEFLTLLGPSGSGKTTFLMIMAGFERPTEGRIRSGGVDITATPAEARAFGMVFQGYALFPHMSVEQNIAFPLKIRRRPVEDIRRRVGQMMERVGLSAQAQKLPAKLSGGQQQRVALARALVFEPSVLLLDEPFSALDKHLRGMMQEEVKRLHQEFGTTFIFVTHDQSEALSLSSRVAIFDHGRLLQVAAPQDVYERPANRFVAEFLGEINLLPLDGVTHCSQGTSGAFEGSRLSMARQKHAGGTGVLAVRPEHMTLEHSGPQNNVHGRNGIAARVVGSSFFGAAMRLALATGGGTTLSVTLPPDQAARLMTGERQLWITWPADKGYLLPEPG